MTLRDYQEKLVHDVEARWAEGHRRVLAVMPTGAGKTRTGVEIVRRALANPRKCRRVVWAVHRAELVRQAEETFKRLTRLTSSSWYSGKSKIETQVIVTTVQTLTKRLSLPIDVGLFVIDEAHRGTSASYQAIARRFGGIPQLGLTATPERGDGVGMGEAFDVIVAGPSYPELIERGHLVDTDVLGPRSASKDLAQDVVSAWRQYAGDRQGFIFAKSRRVSKEYAEALGGVHIDAHTHQSVRIKAFEDFRAGRLKVLCSLQVLTEGIDLPRAEVALLGRLFAHAGGYVQAVGRVMRPSPGKSRALVVDLCGNVHAHGMPSEKRAYSLAGAPISRAEAPQTRRCAKCFAIFYLGPKDCPRCGKRLPLVTVEPQKILGEDLSKVSRPKASMEMKRATYFKWRRMAAEKGWKPQAVAIRFQKTFGHPPPAQWRYEK